VRSTEISAPPREPASLVLHICLASSRNGPDRCDARALRDHIKTECHFPFQRSALQPRQYVRLSGLVEHLCHAVRQSQSQIMIPTASRSAPAPGARVGRRRPVVCQLRRPAKSSCTHGMKSSSHPSRSAPGNKNPRRHAGADDDHLVTAPPTVRHRPATPRPATCNEHKIGNQEHELDETDGSRDTTIRANDSQNSDSRTSDILANARRRHSGI